MSEPERFGFWKSSENAKLVYTFFSFAKGPMHIVATLRRNDNFWDYALAMLARFCDDGFRMVSVLRRQVW